MRIVVVEAVERHIEEGMSPREATLTAMREVSGPVVAIALILAAVFVPVGLMTGVQGRLNQQFAITIAVSVVISAFNALTLSPALAAMLLRPRSTHRGWLARLFGRFNALLERTTSGYTCVSRALIRKPVIGIAVLLLFATAAGLVGRRLPTSFLPEEDYGYCFINIQLPPAASIQRTDEVARKVDALLAKTEGIQTFNTIVGFSLITRVNASNNAFYFVQFKPWEERRSPALQARAIVDKLNARFRTEISEGVAVAIMPPAIPGLGTQGGFTMWLQDRSGGSIDFLNENVQKFLAAARNLAATLLAVFLIPLMFVLFERLALRFARGRHDSSNSTLAPEGGAS
jgi:multidrug efflux pump